MEKFVIPSENSKNAIAFLLMEIHAQNSTILDIQSELLSNSTGETKLEIQNRLESILQKRKIYIRDFLYEHYGRINLDDILS